MRKEMARKGLRPEYLLHQKHLAVRAAANFLVGPWSNSDIYQQIDILTNLTIFDGCLSRLRSYWNHLDRRKQDRVLPSVLYYRLNSSEQTVEPVIPRIPPITPYV